MNNNKNKMTFFCCFRSKNNNADPTYTHVTKEKSDNDNEIDSQDIKCELTTLPQKGDCTDKLKKIEIENANIKLQLNYSKGDEKKEEDVDAQAPLSPRAVVPLLNLTALPQKGDVTDKLGKINLKGEDVDASYARAPQTSRRV